MALTYAILASHVTHALGGAVASQLSVPQIINEAGRFLCTAHPWKSLERPPAALNFVISQAYVALPADFGTLIATDATATTSFCLTDFAHLAQLRAQTVGPIGVTYGAIVQPTQTSAAVAPAVRRIELYPTPAANATAALTVWYRAQWTEMSGTPSTDIPNLPLFLDTLLISCVRAVARGYEEDNIEELLAAVVAGPAFARALEWDGLVQSDYGPLRGGAVESVYGSGRVPFNPVANP